MTSASPQQVPGFYQWRKCISFGDVWLGVVPVLNSVIALNESAAHIWDLLIETNDIEMAAGLYKDRYPSRSSFSDTDVQACIGMWEQQGLRDLVAIKIHNEPRYEHRKTQRFDQMPFHRTLELGSTAVAIALEDPVLAAIFEELTGEFSTAPAAATTLQATGSQPDWRLFKDGTCIRRADSLMLIRGLMVAEMLNTAAAALPAQAMIHGAALVRDGRGVLLTGASGAGKSTLAAVMVAKGWQLAAEDCAIFDSALGVLPMPFALSIKSGAVSALKPYFPALETARVFHLGRRRVRYQPLAPSQRATDRVKPAMIFDVRYRPDLKPTDVLSRPLSPLETLQLFLTEESRIDFEIEGGVPFLKFVEETPAFSLEFGNAETAEQAICQLLNDRKNSR